ncbi:MAG: efflux RND transporter permease subunit, partial [Planctomycetes bacterium]|nr:efflux RND transporter permease subunit [Planctomycetota bacterium]
QENRALPEEERKSALRVVFDASNEIRSSVVFATVIIVLVFTPLLFLEGLEGRFFRPLGIAYIVSLLASLLVALTVTPVLCRLLLGGKSKVLMVRDHEGKVVAWLKRVYQPTLGFALRFRSAIMVAAFALALLALGFAANFGTAFLPKFNEGTFTVFLMAPPGTSLNTSDRLARGVEKRLSEIEGVRAVVRRTGRAENDEHAEPVSSSEIEVSMTPEAERKQVRAEIDEILAKVPGITTMVGQPIEHRLSHVMSGTTADIAINVYGPDLNVLRKLAKDIEGALRGVRGARDVNANREIMIDTLPVEFDQAALTRAGLTRASAAAQVKAAFLGARVATVNDGARRYGLVVRLAEEERASPEDLAELLLIGEGGAKVRLVDVARVGREQASNLIARENVERKATVSLNVGEDSNLGDMIAEVQRRVDPIVREAGYRVHYGGQFEAQQSASKTIAILGAIVLVIMLLLLTGTFRSLKAALLVLVNLPLALIGGVAAVALSVEGNPFTNLWALVSGGNFQAPIVSISTLVGFVSVVGIAVRNGILLVNAYLHLIREEELSVKEAILKGSQDRLIPILMTAITAILGMIPLALAAGEPGSELLAPLAIVVLGGLTSSTLLNLVVVPAGFMLVFGRGGATDVREPERLEAV